jgi:predicted acetyltransferase
LITVRPCTTADEHRRAIVISHYVGGEPTAEDAARNLPIMAHERMHAAWDGDAIVGGAGAFPFDLTVPGGRRVPSAGITMVGVLPTHRRQGVLTGLMRAQLDDVHARGESIAWLWASEGTIYGRFGYGMASLSGELDLDRNRTAFAVEAPKLPARLVSNDEAIARFPAVYDAVAAVTPGMFSRSAAWWELRRLRDAPERRGGAGPLNRVLLEADGVPVAYALYRFQNAIEHHVTTGTLHVVEALGIDGPSTRAIWRYLLDIDWVARIRSPIVAVDHPLHLVLAEPRRMGFRLADGVWVRLVDVGAALSARSYAAGEPVVFDVIDGFCPWNTGRWCLTDGRADRTDLPADVRLDVAMLGAAYLGGFSFRQLAQAGRVVEVRSGGIARADALFRVDRAPWCAEIF